MIFAFCNFAGKLIVHKETIPWTYSSTSPTGGNQVDGLPPVWNILVQEEPPSQIDRVYLYPWPVWRCFGDINYHEMKMCHIENILRVLKFHFGWVWAPGDNVNEISIWLQIFGWGSFLRFFMKKFKKIEFWGDPDPGKLSLGSYGFTSATGGNQIDGLPPAWNITRRAEIFLLEE